MTLSSTSSHYSKPGHSLPNLAIPHTGGEGGGWKWHCYQHLATPGNSLPNQAIPHTGEGEGWRQPQHQLIAEKIQPHPPMFMRPPKSTSGHTLTNMVIPHSQYHTVQKKTMSKSFKSFSSLSLWPYFLLLWFVPVIGYWQSRHSHVFCTWSKKMAHLPLDRVPAWP